MPMIPALKSMVMVLARKVGQKVVYLREGVKRQHSNQYIRYLLRMTKLKDLLRMRRLKLVLDMQKNPSEHTKVRASLGGAP